MTEIKDDTKLCPYCGEEIKAIAIVCRYCNRTLPGYEKKEPPIDLPQLRAMIRIRKKFPLQNVLIICGLGLLVGILFPWSALVFGRQKLEQYSGFTQVPGIITALVGLVIMFVTLLQEANSQKAVSRFSSFLALANLVMLFIWKMAFYNVCPLEAVGEECYKVAIGTGFGYGLSVFLLLVILMVGFLPHTSSITGDYILNVVRSFRSYILETLEDFKEKRSEKSEPNSTSSDESDEKNEEQ